MGTVIDLVAYMALMAWVGCTPSWAKRWSFILGSVWAFFMHKHYTFRQKGRCKKQLIGFMGVYAIGWLVNSYAHDAVLGAWHMRSLAYVVGTALSTVTHFVLQKYFVFTGPKHHDKA